jgi:uncharacterized protein (TIGR03437 family)
MRLQVAAVLALPLAAQVNVLTWQYDNTRAGANRREKILTPLNVNVNSFGKLFSHPVDGFIYGQPLYLGGVDVPERGRRNVVYVATQHDSMYAFDADQQDDPLWHVSFLNPEAGITTVPFADLFGCDQIIPEIGITSTPVIDPDSGTIYVVAMTKENGDWFHRLHALDVATGAEKPGSPVVIRATYPGTGEGGTTVVFQPRMYKQRPGLLLLNGIVYTAWSSHCDGGPFHGWLMGYDARTLRQVVVYNNTPNGGAASFWSGGAAPAVDERGSIYIVGGNGSFDYAFGGTDLGESYIKLSTNGGLAVEDYFTPFNFQELNDGDVDVGSAGLVLMGDEAGSADHPRLLIAAGKEGRIYMMDRDRMGHWQPGSDSQIVATTEANYIAAMFGNPAYFNHSVYFCGAGDPVKAFSVYDAVLSKGTSSESAVQFGYPGCLPTISADGIENAIVWVLEPADILHAYDARNLAVELYNSDQNRARDALGPYVKFTTPMVANGKVYAGTQNSLNVYGLLPGADVLPLAANLASGQRTLLAPGSIVAIRGSELAVSTETSAENPLPLTLGGASVSVNGVPAPLLFASPAELHVQLPFDTVSGPAKLLVMADGRQVASISIMIQSVAPGLFMGDQGRALVQNADGSMNSSDQPAQAGSGIVTYLTGLGAVNPAVATGVAPRVAQVTQDVTATVGGKEARVFYAGTVAGFAGLYQVNMIVPDLPPGDYPVRVIVANVPSNTAVISIR